jgi:hypothetical protein
VPVRVEPGSRQKPAALSRLLHELRALPLWNQKAVPWYSFVPDLVTMFRTEPALRPYSGRNWFVMRRTSCTMSGLLIDCWPPETDGSLMSCPSIMKLFERRRPPFEE